VQQPYGSAPAAGSGPARPGAAVRPGRGPAGAAGSADGSGGLTFTSGNHPRGDHRRRRVNRARRRRGRRLLDRRAGASPQGPDAALLGLGPGRSALTVPATWPAVVQLQAAFGDWFVPGPNLRAWIQLQAEARTNLPAFDETLVPRGPDPLPVAGQRRPDDRGRADQRRGAHHRRARHRQDHHRHSRAGPAQADDGRSDTHRRGVPGLGHRLLGGGVEGLGAGRQRVRVARPEAQGAGRVGRRLRDQLRDRPLRLQARQGPRPAGRPGAWSRW
jgi:hypothetical protein